MIGSVEPEICTKMLRNLSEKLAAKLPATTFSLVRIARLEYAFPGIFEQETSPVAGQSLQQNDKERRKRKRKKMIVKINNKTTEKP